MPDEFLRCILNFCKFNIKTSNVSTFQPFYASVIRCYLKFTTQNFYLWTLLNVSYSAKKFSYDNPTADALRLCKI